jgi:O-antigen chain-terminating methyltransferase
MRGPSDDVRSRQARYVDDFRDAAPVLDAGCGRGEFLELLRDAGVEARGVDSDEDMVAFCRSRGLNVVKADAIAHLHGLPDASLGGVFTAQLVEHLAPQALLRLLDLSASKLRQDGVLVIETINPLSFIALRHFFADLTHSHPLVPATLELMARQSGFRQVELRFLNEPPESERLRDVDLPHEPEFDDARRALAANVERLNDVIFGPQDYALVARR